MGEIGLDDGNVAVPLIRSLFAQQFQIFKADDPANGFYYISEGNIRLYKLDSNGKELEISRLGKGEYLGEIILFATDRFPVFAESLDNSQVLFFTKELVLKAIETEPRVAKFLLTLFAKKCYGLNQRLTMLTMQNIRQRLCAYLMSLCTGDSCTINLPMKKVELANHLMTTPETISRMLNQLEDDKTITVSGKKITVLDCPKLKKNLI